MPVFLRRLVGVLAFWLFFSASGWAQGLLVSWRADAVQWVLQGYPAQMVSEADDASLLVRYAINDKELIKQFIFQLRQNPDVRYAEPDYAIIPLASNWPQHFAMLGLDSLYWPSQLNCSAYPVALMDTGVDRSHLALPLDKYYWPDINLLSATGLVQDDQGHGTHIAGLMAAASGIESGVAGVCKQLYLLSIRFMGKNGSVSDAVRGIDLAVAQGAKIINASWTVDYLSEALVEAVARADTAEVLVVAAAGNARQDLAVGRVYPAVLSEQLRHVVTVGNLQSDAALYGDAKNGSNFGVHQVDVGAPGVALKSTDLNGTYSWQTGTSMAAPLISAGLAALGTRFASDPAAAIKAALLNSVQPQAQLKDQLRYPGAPDLGWALSASISQVLKPAWFNVQWDAGSRRLLVQGYDLDRVDAAARLQNPATGEYRLLNPYDLDVISDQQLAVYLPDGWSTDWPELQLYVDGVALNPVSLQHKVPDAAEGFVFCGYQGECSLKLADGVLSLKRSLAPDAPEQAVWWLTDLSALTAGELALTGKDLSGEWLLTFYPDQPGYRVNQLLVRTAAEEQLQSLEQQGLQRLSDTSFRWMARSVDWDQHQGKAAVEQFNLQLIGAVPGDSRCFVASHVYQPGAAELQVLRDFRDEVLLQNAAGRWLVQTYYRYSPAWVEWMQDKPRLTAVIRWLLDGLVGLISFLQGSIKHG